MAVPQSSDELIAAVETTFGKLITDLERVPPQLARDASLDGHVAGTQMSPADLVAYLIGWNELVLKWLDLDDRGVTPDFPETGFQWNRLGQLAQKFYADHQTDPWPALLTRLKAVKARLSETIAARSDAELYGEPWYGKWTKGRMIQFNTSSPYTNARGRIRSWLRKQGQ
ncbi:ClbS/DfsB family four-helix bundle protein [Pseudogemmobacter bohemicus]|uniref:ClbS/DfsB family four-helix bundle protein n=1 Tax=Pseudogemmobacter bohemicus TaxID=2250708 RepID=UPI000DD3C366|nr:ClbS/DfsB family four-helix bundle protein [Pseudogemmobacter bohemicus]